eukprot:GHVT01053239.1.p1 GENE.GHVT01053239.1~~GHVT01053239.1.p1  ORF type:complete len:187 (+),score=13.73 GHVT01053239.1:178-738(+)
MESPHFIYSNPKGNIVLARDSHRGNHCPTQHVAQVSRDDRGACDDPLRSAAVGVGRAAQALAKSEVPMEKVRVRANCLTFCFHVFCLGSGEMHRSVGRGGLPIRGILCVAVAAIEKKKDLSAAVALVAVFGAQYHLVNGRIAFPVHDKPQRLYDAIHPKFTWPLHFRAAACSKRRGNKSQSSNIKE